MADLAADPVADAPPLKAQTLDAIGAALGVAALVGFVMVRDTLPGGTGLQGGPGDVTYRSVLLRGEFN